MIISTIQAQRMISNGCIGFLASAIDKTKEVKLSSTDVPIIRDSVEVFLSRGVTRIASPTRTVPISKALYRMALAELKDLQTQL